jgi:hypothetical protein
MMDSYEAGDLKVLERKLELTRILCYYMDKYEKMENALKTMGGL